MLVFSSVMNSMMGFSLSVLVMSFGWMLSFNTLMDHEKDSPLECGFDPLKSARLPYSMRFFFNWLLFFLFFMLKLFYYFHY